MAWSMGLLGASISEPAPTGFDLIDSQYLTSTTSSITFSNLDSYSDVFYGLQVRWTARGTRSLVDGFTVRINEDSGNNYYWHGFRNQNNSVLGYSSGSTKPEMEMGVMPAIGEPSEVFGSGIIDIYDAFDSTKNTVLYGRANLFASNLTTVRKHSGIWLNTATLSSLTFGATNESLAANSEVSLYGLVG